VIGQWVVGVKLTLFMALVILLYIGLSTLWAFKGFGVTWHQALVIASATSAITLLCGAALIYLFIYAFGNTSA
ncbi:MAG: hypothetical protein ACREJQ_02480, partial [bacterium]